MIGAPLGLLRAVPVWAWAVCAALAWGGIQHHRARAAGDVLRAAERAAAAQEAQALRQSITETERRVQAQQEAASAAHAHLERARRDAAAARAAADRVRDAARAFAASAAADGAAPAGRCQAAERAAGVLSELLGRAVDRAAVLADLADRSRAAGQACERAYDALTPGG